ncbi:MAG: hypothetical protein OEW12_01630 [Deltaproteobacteria bacterium]|nr:hypothetical protein [Deltaproteobacteria bacterium]
MKPSEPIEPSVIVTVRFPIPLYKKLQRMAVEQTRDNFSNTVQRLVLKGLENDPV